jgi:hypothetical protein
MVFDLRTRRFQIQIKYGRFQGLIEIYIIFDTPFEQNS